MNRVWLFLVLASLSFALIFELPVNNLNYKIEKVKGFDRIKLENGFVQIEPGSPEIPGIVYTYTLAPGKTIKTVRIVEERWQEVPGNFYIYPSQKQVSLEELPEFSEPDPEIYSTNLPFPNSILRHYTCGNLRGYSLAQFALLPFRYFPKSGRLEVLTSLKLEIATDLAKPGIMPKRQTSLSRALFKRFVSSVLKATHAANPVIEPYCNIEENPQDLVPTDLPSLIGPPVDLVIITTEPLVNAYEEFSRLKRLFGFNTVIRTLTWVRQHYQGIDDAERIRNFLKDGVEKWGVSYLLLGGDVPKIPTRWAWMESGVAPLPAHVVTDLYFSDLDGNWNFDGDERFGEVEDSLDLYPDLFVGRLSTDIEQEVLGYLNKVNGYLFPASPNLTPIKALFFSSNLFWPGDGLAMAGELAQHLPPYFIKSFLNEEPVQTLKDSLYQGYNIIMGIGHGEVNSMRVRSGPRENITNFFCDSLMNNDYGAMFIISCYTGPFQLDALGEEWVNNPQGGGISYIGPTYTSEAEYHQDLQELIFDSLFYYPLSAVLAKAKIHFIPHSHYNGWFRLYQFGINLLGDPSLLLWDSIPNYYNSVTVQGDTMDLGLDTLTLSLDPLVPFTVVLYKENETFIRDSSTTGVLQVQVKTKSPGYLKYTILNKDFVPIIDSIFVRPVSPYLVCAYKTVLDTTANGNGVVNPGEEIFLNIGIKNNGSALASAVSAKLFSADSFITIITDLAGYPEIWPGQTKENLSPFHFKVLNTIPDKHSLDFNLVINYSGTSNADTFQLTVQAPKLRLYTQRYRILADTLKVQTLIENCGQAMADSVIGRVGVYSDTLVVIDSVVNFPNLAPGAILAAFDSFRFYLNYPGTVVYNLRLYYRGLEISNQQIRLGVPLSPDSLRTVGTRHSIILEWEPVPGALGYRIYRAGSLLGPYQFMKNRLAPVTYFEDFTAQQSIDYYYYLSAVDSSMNEGAGSDTVLGRRNPAWAPGWPQVMESYTYSSPNFGDIDPAYPGLEIVTAAHDGSIYAWHYDGTPVANDGRIFVVQGISFPWFLWSSPAIGDLNNDGKEEIVFGVRRVTGPNLYVLTKETSWVCMPGWPKTIGRIIGSPVLGDIDEDGQLEIVVMTDCADLYVFNYDGTGLYSESGLLYSGHGNHRGTPAVGDIDQDGDLEIVACGGSESESLYVWDRYGNHFPGFPVFIQPERRLRCSVVLGDILGDGRLEIAFYADSTMRVYLISADGDILWHQDLYFLEIIDTNPIFADITGDARPELICGDNKVGLLWAFDSLGNSLPGFPLYNGHGWRKPFSVDLDSDNISDIGIGSSDWNFYGYKNSLQAATGFPILLGNRLEVSPAAYDLDLDGRLELMISAQDYRFHVFDLSSTHYEWPKFRYDPYNTGTYQSGNLPGVKEIARGSRVNIGWLQVYPTVFREKTCIKFQIPNSKSQIPISIYDATGRLVKSFNPLTNYQSPIIWSGEDDLGRKLPSGVYFVQLEPGDYKNVKKAVLVR